MRFTKQDQKVKKNRVANNLETKYSESEQDLGNVEEYEEFLKILVSKIFLQCARTLKTGKYMAIVVSDFRDKSDYISFHSDLIHDLNKAEIPDGGILKLQGTKILLQNHKIYFEVNNTTDNPYRVVCISYTKEGG